MPSPVILFSEKRERERSGERKRETEKAAGDRQLLGGRPGSRLERAAQASRPQPKLCATAGGRQQDGLQCDFHRRP